MSVRAYRVIEVKTADPSFNLYDDRALAIFLGTEADFFDKLHEGAGTADVPIKVLRKAVRIRAKLHLSEGTVTRLKQDIAAAEYLKDESVTYYCF